MVGAAIYQIFFLVNHEILPQGPSHRPSPLLHPPSIEAIHDTRVSSCFIHLSIKPALSDGLRCLIYLSNLFSDSTRDSLLNIGVRPGV